MQEQLFCLDLMMNFTTFRGHWGQRKLHFINLVTSKLPLSSHKCPYLCMCVHTVLCLCVCLLINWMEGTNWAVRARCEGWCIIWVLSVIASVAACLMHDQTDSLSRKKTHRFDALTAIIIFPHLSSSPWPRWRTRRVIFIKCIYQVNWLCGHEQPRKRAVIQLDTLVRCLQHCNNHYLNGMVEVFVNCSFQFLAQFQRHKAFLAHLDTQLAKVCNHLGLVSFQTSVKSLHFIILSSHMVCNKQAAEIQLYCLHGVLVMMVFLPF